MERQLTQAPHGHVLTNANVWSPDSQWIVYDIRSDPAGSQFNGTRIERVHIKTGEVQTLYESRRNACCGVATCSPIDDRVAFILGPEDPTPDWQYSAYHRRGVIVDANRPGVIENLDARDVTPPFTPGALRGGTHVHVFSGDAQWVSFTYEDHILATHPLNPVTPSSNPVTPRYSEESGQSIANADLNQRNIAVAAAYAAVNPPPTHPRNHPGQFFSVLATKTVNEPRPGTDDIQRAYEEAWIGAHGYRRTDGRWQWPALAFLGDLLDAAGKPLTELFIVDLPEDVTRPGDGPLEGTPTSRPVPPAGTRQRRLTFTADKKFPGIQGPRHWPRSSPDGSLIAFLMRDDAGVLQLWTISPNGGPPRQITADPWDVESAFTWSPWGTLIAYVGDRCVMAVDVASGESTRINPPSPAADRPRPEACVFSPDGRHLAFCREIAGPTGRFNQVCVVESP